MSSGSREGHPVQPWPDALLIRRARAQFFEQARLGPDGGDSSAFAYFRVGPLTFPLPNPPARKRAVRLHDLHHIATGYDTTWKGEAEIAAWELGAGCSRCAVAWVINLQAIPLGLAIAPVRTWRAFLRGRNSDTLYQGTWREEWLDLSVGELRKRLGLLRPPRRASLADRLLFAACAVPTVAPLIGAVIAAWLLVT